MRIFSFIGSALFALQVSAATWDIAAFTSTDCNIETVVFTDSGSGTGVVSYLFFSVLFSTTMQPI
jgi:hypothetical protein